jgi:hypothetical protein
LLFVLLAFWASFSSRAYFFSVAVKEQPTRQKIPAGNDRQPRPRQPISPGKKVCGADFFPDATNHRNAVAVI